MLTIFLDDSERVSSELSKVGVIECLCVIYNSEQTEVDYTDTKIYQ